MEMERRVGGRARAKKKGVHKIPTAASVSDCLLGGPPTFSGPHPRSYTVGQGVRKAHPAGNHCNESIFGTNGKLRAPPFSVFLRNGGETAAVPVDTIPDNAPKPTSGAKSYRGAVWAPNHSASPCSVISPAASPRMVRYASSWLAVTSSPFTSRNANDTTRAVRLLPSIKG